MGFNGAASWKTRKPDTATLGALELEVLQWGRVVEDAETPIAIVPLTSTHVASMGPRRGRRGNLSQLVNGNTADSGLQWGRVVEDAETRLGRPRAEEPLGLQWGRVVEDAETASPDRIRKNLQAASMGPRRGRRGNLRQPDRRDRRRPASMGPRRGRRGNRRERVRGVFGLDASMGPRRGRRGNSSALAGRARRRAASMGPRRGRRGNGRRVRGPHIAVDASMGPRRGRRGNRHRRNVRHHNRIRRPFREVGEIPLLLCRVHLFSPM